MRNNVEPAAFLFPLPPELREQYYNWSKTHQQSAGADGNQPILIPVYPAFPGTVPYPPNYSGGGGYGMPGMNPFILFLILILLVVAFKKDQIVEAIKKMIIK